MSSSSGASVKRRDDGKVTFLVFFLMWAKLMGWVIPRLHVRICVWLEACTDRVRVLSVFRGAAKSTLYAIYKAWKLYLDRSHRNLIWSEDTRTASKMTRDVRNILTRHPLCRGMLPPNPGEQEFWVNGAADWRNPSMAAYGVISNATGSRANDVDFDDIEVPKNIKTKDAREKLRERISESTHILLPSGTKTYIGTPHTSDSIYDEQAKGGAAVLKIPLFEHVVRYEDTAKKTRYKFDFPVGDDGLYVILGIGKFARVADEGADYQVRGREVVFGSPPQAVLDICAGNAWPERFTRAEIEFRRKETRTLNAWDSQYQLESRPIGSVRLDPDRMIAYDVEPRIERRNGEVRMLLGGARIVGAIAYWDTSLGKVKSDDSAFSVVFTDDAGRYYWHRALGLKGDLEVMDDKDRLVGGQCGQIADAVVDLQLPCVVVETNGAGGFVPPILRKHLKLLGCAVRETYRTGNKQKFILDALEPPLSSRFLWVHTSVLEGPAYDEMKDFNPLAVDQPDSYIDSAAGAIKETPMRIGRTIGEAKHREDSWRPSGGVHEVVLET
jgi:hypothetical protein